MNKTDLAEQFAEKHGISVATATTYINTMLEAITQSLADGEEVRFNGFGAFEVKYAKERAGHNPRTGETITIDACNRVKFHAGDALKTAVNS